MPKQTLRKEERVWTQSEDTPGRLKVSALGNAWVQLWWFGWRNRPRDADEQPMLDKNLTTCLVLSTKWDQPKEQDIEATRWLSKLSSLADSLIGPEWYSSSWSTDFGVLFPQYPLSFYFFAIESSIFLAEYISPTRLQLSVATGLI